MIVQKTLKENNNIIVGEIILNYYVTKSLNRMLFFLLLNIFSLFYFITLFIVIDKERRILSNIFYFYSQPWSEIEIISK